MGDFEGVYEPDPDEVEEWQNREAETYGGELRYVNLGPQEVRRRLEAEADPKEKAALRTAEEYWQRAGGYATAGWTEAGSVFRGEPREVRVAESMSELAGEVSPVSYVGVVDSLRSGGMQTKSEPMKPGDYVDSGIIDWSHLLSMGPLPESEDWF
jgi:hypothetical protein